MLRPSEDEFAALANQGNLIPVVREVLADTETPVSLFQRLDDGRTAFLFESVEGGEKWARYSFIGLGARSLFRSKDKRVEWMTLGETVWFEAEGDPLSFLRDRLAEHRPVDIGGDALPRFTGGAVGAVSWDWVRQVENIPNNNPDELGMPDAWFIVPETVVVYDNVKHTAIVIHEVALLSSDDPRTRYRDAVVTINEVVSKIRQPWKGSDDSPKSEFPDDVTATETCESYCEMVSSAKGFIEKGDVFQVVISQRFSMACPVDPILIYRHLRRINPSPYLFFLRCDDSVLIGSSPEILVRLEDGRIDLRPIAGTRPRGNNPDEDKQLERELLEDTKERAEHLMLVDLGRNDVGRVAEIGSVKVSDYAFIERYSHVMHIVSSIVGRLHADKDWLSLLRATFPAGTLSGAPKVRAMEIIDELERVKRGPYGGCVGYIDYSGNMDMAVTIRTMVVKDGKIHLQAGSGIVADSDPQSEFEESMNKARALVRSIESACEGSD